jgi:large subunit ribosomal protein L10
MPTPQKEAVVRELGERLSKANAIFISDYSGLDVAALTELRTKLRAADAEMSVVKNNLIRLSLKETDWASAGEDLHGPCAITLAYGEAPKPAKVMNDFAKANGNKPAVTCIAFEEAVHEGDFLSTLAAMPTRDEALGMLASSLNSIIGGFARVLNAVQEKKEEMADAPAAEAAPEATDAPAEVEEGTAAEAPAEEGATDA